MLLYWRYLVYKFLPPKNCLLCYYKLQLQEPANMDPNIILELRAPKKKNMGQFFANFGISKIHT